MCKAVRVQQPYNHKSGTKSFLQQQVELTELHGRPVDRVKLFKETHACSSGDFISPTVENAFVSSKTLLFVYTFFFLKSDHLSNLQASVVQKQMVELQSQPVL